MAAGLGVADLPGGLEAVHDGHLHVHQNQIIPGGGGGLNGLLAVAGDIRFQAKLLQNPQGDLLVGDIVLHDEDPGIFKVIALVENFQISGRRGGGLDVDLPGRLGQAEGVPEFGALAGFAADADFTAHGFHELFADGQAEAGAAVKPGGRGVHLTELVKQPGNLVLGDADAGVADGKMQLQTVRDGGVENTNMDTDSTLRGKLDGVADQIGEDLANPHGIAADQRGDFRGDAGSELDFFLLRLQAHDGDHVFQLAAQAEIHFLQLHFPSLDFREIQDVIDELQQGFAAVPGQPEEVVLLGRQLGVVQQGEHAEDAVHGGPDFVAHVGEEFALGQVGDLGLLGHGFGLGNGHLEILFNVFLGGGIPVGANHLDHLTLGVSRRNRLGADVVDAAIRPHHAELGVELFFAPQSLLDFLLGPQLIGGMQARLPGVISTAKLISADAIERKHLIIPEHPIFQNIPIPDADVAGAGGEFQPVRRHFQLVQCGF